MESLKTKKIFLLNGPASSGKDSIGKYLSEKYPHVFKVDKFSYPLKEANKVLFSLDDKTFNEYDTNAELKNTKDERFYWYSWRQVNIDLSEIFIKTHYGNDFFGRSLVERIKQSDGTNFLIPDSGFISEANPVVKEFGKDNVYLIKLNREGFDFTGDSRNYINGWQLGIKEYSLENKNFEKFLSDAENLILNDILMYK